MSNFEKATARPWARGLEQDETSVQLIGADGSHIAYIECDPLDEHLDLIVASINSYNARQQVTQALVDLRALFLQYTGEAGDFDIDFVDQALHAVGAKALPVRVAARDNARRELVEATRELLIWANISDTSRSAPLRDHVRAALAAVEAAEGTPTAKAKGGA